MTSSKKDRSWFIILITLMISLCFIAVNAGQFLNLKSRVLSTHRENEILIKFRPGLTYSDKMAAIVQLNGIEYQELNFSDITRVILKEETDLSAAIAHAGTIPGVLFAQPNYTYKIQAMPNDPDYSEQWLAPERLADEDMADEEDEQLPLNPDMEEAWDLVNDCSQVTIAVIDTGINYTHEDLAGNLWNGIDEGYDYHGYDFVDEDNDPMDMNGHGSHMAGIIGAVGNNATGITGLCWSASIMTIRVLDETGRGTTADIIQGIAFAVDHGAHIALLSFGNENPFDRALNEAVALCKEYNIVAIAPAGNGNTDSTGIDIDRPGTGDRERAFYPCSLEQENIICVAALDEYRDLASYSNFGNRSVDIAAPGESVLSTGAGELTVYADTFTSDWVMTGGWDHDSIDLGFGTYDMLINPYDWDQGLYANSLDARAYKSFDISSFDAAILNFFAFVNTETDHDYFNLTVSTGGNDPFTHGDTLDSMTGETGNNAYLFTYDLTAYRDQKCTIGFQLITDQENSRNGVGIFQFEITGLQLNSQSYIFMQGTSQSAAYVCGIAALLKAFNPDYTADDITKAMTGGGTSSRQLKEKIKSGKEASIMGSLLYIESPGKVQASVVNR